MKIKKLLSLVLSLFILITALPYSVEVSAATVSIPSDAVYYNGHYYKVYVNSSIWWHDAKTVCENKGGHLATIANEEENSFVHSLVKEKGVPCWLGATDENSEGNWKWVTGEPWSYNNTNFDNRHNSQHYLVINYNGNGQWDDQSEKNDSFYVIPVGMFANGKFHHYSD